MGSWLLGGAAVLVLLLSIQTNRVSGLQEKNRTLADENVTLTDNYLTCETINKNNREAIAKQKASIDEFIAQQDAIVAHANKLAHALAHEQERARNEARIARNQAQAALSAEACAVAEPPDDVSRLLNDAIAQASAGGGADR